MAAHHFTERRQLFKRREGEHALLKVPPVPGPRDDWGIPSIRTCGGRGGGGRGGVRSSPLLNPSPLRARAGLRVGATAHARE